MTPTPEPAEAEPDLLHRLPYEATLTIMAPWRDGPEARATRRRLLAARDLASRALGRGGLSEEMRWVVCALLRVSSEYCYCGCPLETLEIAVEFAVRQWNAATLLHKLEMIERRREREDVAAADAAGEAA
jgi:hypothetical protein